MIVVTLGILLASSSFSSFLSFITASQHGTHIDHTWAYMLFTEWKYNPNRLQHVKYLSFCLSKPSTHALSVRIVFWHLILTAYVKMNFCLQIKENQLYYFSEVSPLIKISHWVPILLGVRNKIKHTRLRRSGSHDLFEHVWCYSHPCLLCSNHHDFLASVRTY